MGRKKTTQTGERSRPAHRWSWWLMPKPFDLVISLLYISVPFFSILFVSSDCACYPLSRLRAILLIVITIILLAVDRIEYWFYGEKTPVKVAIIFLVTRIILIETVTQLDYFRFSIFLYLLVPLQASLYFGSLVGYGCMIIVWLMYVVKVSWLKPGWLGRPTSVHDLVIYTLGLIFAITVAKAFVKERSSRSKAEHLLTELEESHQQLKVYADQVAELATTKERNRLARDIHDTLGHYLTVINVQLEKALVFRHKKPQEADLAVSDAKRMASEALQDVRRSVSALRTNSEMQAFVPAMVELIERMQSSQLRVELHINGSEDGFPRQALMALYRAAQEGLTNVQKHAHATHVQVTLQIDGGSATLELSDNGEGFDVNILCQQQPGFEDSYGLQGLQERLELVRGSLKIDSAPGQGTHLLAIVPKEGYVPGVAGQNGEAMLQPEFGYPVGEGLYDKC